MLAMLGASRNGIEILKCISTTSIKLGASIFGLAGVFEPFIDHSDDKDRSLYKITRLHILLFCGFKFLSFHLEFCEGLEFCYPS